MPNYMLLLYADEPADAAEIRKRDEDLPEWKRVIEEFVADGSFVGSGRLRPSETATTVAMVLTELLQNAVEHGYPEDAACGTITLDPERIAGRLRVTVDDDGVGLPAGFDPEMSVNLGLSIVRTLVESELGGLLELRPGPERGSRAVVDVPLDGR